MVPLVAAGIGSVMRLSSCSCRLLLDVRIAAFTGAMVWECLADSKVVSSFFTDEMVANIFTCSVIRRLRS